MFALIFSFAALIIGFIGEGGHVAGLFNWTPAMIVFGGSLGSLMTSFAAEDLKRIGKVASVAFTTKPKDLSKLILYFSELAVKIRKDGILSLEVEIGADANIDPFIKKGLQLVVDGVDRDEVKSILDVELDNIILRHKTGSAMFNALGGTAPTMGIVGTVLGLVHVLAGLATTDQSKLGESISAAFLATLYGLSSANLIFLPIGVKLKQIDVKEQLEKELIIEAILLIQQGVNPSVLTEKLKGFLNKQELAAIESSTKSE
jgi:chemotaxis protein MotA